MRRLVLSLVGAVLIAAAPPAVASQHDVLPPERPRWGPVVDAGSTITQDAEAVLEAVDLIRTGEKYLLGHRYTPRMPLFPGNSWALAAKGSIKVGRQIFNAEHFAGDIAQSGTQFDTFGHFGVLATEQDPPTAAYYYGRLRGTDVNGPFGLHRLAIEHLRPLFTRGVLIDVVRGANGGRPLAPGSEITPDMAATALAAQRMSFDDIREGDAVLVRTGWEERWDDGTLDYYAGAPGMGGAVPGVGWDLARVLAERGVAVVGADNWGVEVFPAPSGPAGLLAPVHNELLVRNGIPLQESMVLSALADELAEDFEKNRRPPTFAYIFVPVPIEGASGSPGIPLAVR